MVGQTIPCSAGLQAHNTDPLQVSSSYIFTYHIYCLQEIERRSSPHHTLGKRWQRQEHDRDYDSGPDDSDPSHTSSDDSSDPLDHVKQQVRITERAQ